MDRIPEFSLPDAQGRPWGSKQLLQRQEMVVLLVGRSDHAECRRAVEALARRQEADQLAGAAVMAIVGPGAEKALEGLAPPFAILSDESGHVSDEIAQAAGLPQGGSAIVVSDRYGVIDWASALHATEAEKLVEDAFASVEYVELRCPE
jgi:peroxiredoxin